MKRRPTAGGLAVRVCTFEEEVADLMRRPEGWTPGGWIERLRYLANVCVVDERKAALIEAAKRLGEGCTTEAQRTQRRI